MTKLTQRLVILLFPMALALPAASILLPTEPTEIENRRLEAPEVSFDRLDEPRFYRELGAYIRDANPVRALLIRGGTGIDYHLFGDSPNPLSAVVGREGWLYQRKQFEVLCEGDPRNAETNLLALVRAIQDTGADVVYTVAPSKFTVVPDYLTEDQARLAACGLESASSLRALLSEEAEPGYVDSWALFSSMRSLGIDPYFKTDTHFNYVGSVPWMQALITAIEPGIWEPGSVQNLGDIQFGGNIALTLGLESSEVVRHVVVDRGLPRDPVERLHDRFGEFHFSTQRYRAPEGSDTAVIEGRAVVLADSFMDIPAPSLVQYFRDITIMDWRSQDSIDYFLEQAHGADIVIIETSNEGIFQRFGSRDLVEYFLDHAETNLGSSE